MVDLSQLNIEKANLESNLQLFIKENLESKELKEEYETEVHMLNNEVSKLDKDIASLKKKIENNANEYSYDKENKLFNKVIAANLIPGLSIGALFMLTGNSHIIGNMGVFSSLLTGIPTLLVSSVIYMNDLKNIRNENKKDFLSTDEYKSLGEELSLLETQRLSLKDKIRDLNIEINKIKTSIHSKGCQIVSIKNRISDINCALRTGVVNSKEENINLQLSK